MTFLYGSSIKQLFLVRVGCVIKWMIRPRKLLLSMRKWESGVLDFVNTHLSIIGTQKHVIFGVPTPFHPVTMQCARMSVAKLHVNALSAIMS